MTRHMTATELNAKILSLLDEVARLVPATGPARAGRSLVGLATSNARDDELFSTGETWDLA